MKAEDNAALKMEVAQLSKLMDSVQRLETGLVGQKDQEIESISQERGRLSNALHKAQKELQDAALRADQQRDALQSESARLRVKLETAEETAAAADKKLAEEAGKLQVINNSS